MDSADIEIIPLQLDVYESDSYNDIRRNKLLMFGMLLLKHDECRAASEDQMYEYIKNIERSCYNSSIDKATSPDYDIHPCWTNERFVNIYHDICASIASHIDMSEIVVQRIMSSDIDTSQIGKMNIRILRPDLYATYMQTLDKYNGVDIKLKTTSLYRCGKCKQNQCMLQNVISRSIDEGTSVIAHCMFCGNSWSV